MILIVGYDNKEVEVVKSYLKFERFDTYNISSCSEALKAFNRLSVKCIVLSSVQPEGENIPQFIEKIRGMATDTHRTHLVYLANGDTFDESLVDAKFDDVSQIMDICDKIHCLLDEDEPVDRVVNYGHVSITLGKASDVKVHDKPVKLTRVQAEFLAYLFERQGEFISIEQMLDEFFRKSDLYVWSSIIDNAIEYFQELIEERPKRPKFIKHIIGVGYYVTPLNNNNSDNNNNATVASA